MFETLAPAVIAAVTSVTSVVLPLVAANTGRNALQKDMDLYKQWCDITASCPVESVDESDEAASSKAPDFFDIAGAPDTVSTAEPAILTEAANIGQKTTSKISAQSSDVAECDELTTLALTKFRHFVDLQLIVRSRNRDLAYPIYVVVLIVLFLCYMVCQVTFRSEGITDDLIRSFI